MSGGGGSRRSDLIKTIYHTVLKTYRHAPMNPEKPTALLAISIGVPLTLYCPRATYRFYSV